MTTDTKKPIERTTRGLCEHLFSTLEALRDGNVTAQDAKVTANLAQQLQNCKRLELDAARFVSDVRRDDAEDDGAGKIKSLTFT